MDTSIKIIDDTLGFLRKMWMTETNSKIKAKLWSQINATLDERLKHMALRANAEVRDASPHATNNSEG